MAVDLSGEQLATARRLQRGSARCSRSCSATVSGCRWPTACVDLVVSEHGAAAWCDPERWLPEAARVLRPGGRLVFLTNSHLSALCVPPDEGVAEERLLRGYAEAYRVQWPGGGVEFHPSHGDWVRLLRAAGFVVEALHELFAPADGADHPFYEIVSPSGRAAGRPRSSGWPAAPDAVVRGRAQCAVQPPSMRSDAPVIDVGVGAAEEAREAATSRGLDEPLDGGRRRA